METIQFNACLAITGAIRGTSREKILQELGLESLQFRRWYRTRCLFYKVVKNKHPKYLFHLIPVISTSDATSTESSFPSAIIEWNNLDPNLRNPNSISVFKEENP